MFDSIASSFTVPIARPHISRTRIFHKVISDGGTRLLRFIIFNLFNSLLLFFLQFIMFAQRDK